MGTVGMPQVAVTLGLWQDRPPEEALATAAMADRLGYNELWVGEMATYDAFTLATRIGAGTERIGFVLGPLAVSVRDPMSMAIGVASVASLTGRPVGVAVGTSSAVVVEQWHGRRRERPAQALEEAARALRSLLDGEKSRFEGEVVSSRGYRLRLAPPRSPLTVAAFGPAAVRVAARLADRMVINLVTPASAARLVHAVRSEAQAAGRPAPRVALWCSSAVDPDEDAYHQLRRGLVSYLGVAGYAEMFEEAGYGDLVALARTRPHPAELLAAIPDALVEEVGLVGSPERVTARLAAYADAGVDEVSAVAACTDSDPGGAHTLEAVRALAEPTGPPVPPPATPAGTASGTA
jgi:probable F420-dependent oxidoreductase